jgi:hypothetical protein
MNKEVVYEFSFSTTQGLVDKLTQIGGWDAMYVRASHTVSGGYLLGNAQVVEETLTDGSKVRDLILS